jgi:hypothetical protein
MAATRAQEVRNMEFISITRMLTTTWLCPALRMWVVCNIYYHAYADDEMGEYGSQEVGGLEFLFSTSMLTSIPPWRAFRECVIYIDFLTATPMN